MLQSSLWRHQIKLELCTKDKSMGKHNPMTSGLYVIGSSISLQSSEGEVIVLVMNVNAAILSLETPDKIGTMHRR
jgi:hypothetical protein